MTYPARVHVPLLAILLSAALLASVTSPGASAGIVPRHVAPKPDAVRFTPSCYPRHLNVKFIETSAIRLREGELVSLAGLNLDDLGTVLDSYEGIEIRRLFLRSEEELAEAKTQGEARTGWELADLNLWYRIIADGDFSLDLANDLNRLDIVEVAHFEVRPEPAWLEGSADARATHGGRRDATALPSSARLIPDMTRVPDGGQRTPDFSDMQDYLFDAPVGLEAPAAWSLPGGRGSGLKFIDVELAWQWTHEDLVEPFFTGGIPNSYYTDHGTAVMGEVVGQDNGYGIIGFASDLEVGGVAININDYPNCAAWFDMASANLDPGDIWLIELHMPGPNYHGSGTYGYVPMEWVQENFDAIQTSTANGRICVEAGGNGTEDLDDPIYGGLFDRQVRDSGAILAAAGTPYGLQPEWFTNWGSRMDAHGWGSQIVTTGYGDLQGGGPDQEYTASFGGTSGASPMVVGAVACVQGAWRAKNDAVLGPLTIRQIITETGTPQGSSPKYIAPRPNIADALESLLGTGVHDAGRKDGEFVSLAPVNNPCLGSASITFTLPRPGRIELSAYDVSGRRVADLVKAPCAAGKHTAHWDGTNTRGQDLPSGVYFLRLTTPRETVTERVVLVK